MFMNSVCQVAPACSNITDMMTWAGIKKLDQKTPLG